MAAAPALLTSRATRFFSPSRMQPLDRLDAAFLSQALSVPVEVLDECSSTNSVLLEDGSSGPRLLACERQTAGRGRRGSVWHSSPGDSLCFSLLWPFARGAQRLNGLSLAMGVACARSCAALGVPLQLKWPNDLLLHGRKAGGVLIELKSGESKTGSAQAVIGVGLNVRAAARHQAQVEQPVAALSDAGTPLPSRSLLLRAVAEEIISALKRFETEGFAAFRPDWLRLHAHTGRAVRLVDGARQIDGIATGVSEDGALVLATEEGERRFLAGELSLRLAA
jgi:BirA family transcriptional regulator, biotin operon repressor / biotin---[acetyl-CoA-carboxylase] ligase